MLGYPRAEELKGCSKFDFIHPAFHPSIRERVDRILGKGGANPLLKMKMVTKGGEPLEVEPSSISIQYNGKPAVMGVLRDITLQNQMERQGNLNEKLATVGTLAAGIAHEINNPLTYVLANVVFLLENLQELKDRMEEKGHVDAGYPGIFKEMQEEIAQTTQGGGRIRDIVRGLKSFVRSDEDEVTVVDLNQMVEMAINMTFHEFKQKARVEKDFALHLPPLTANGGKLQQVFINLLINAAQAIEGNNPEDNKIHIRTGEHKGIPFRRVYRYGQGNVRKRPGPHLRPLFHHQAGGDGDGTGSFHLRKNSKALPGDLGGPKPGGNGDDLHGAFCRWRDGFKAVPAWIRPHRPPRSGDGCWSWTTNPATLEVLARMLKKKNDVLCALTGLDALAILEREGGRMDSIVSDINMPDMDGIALYHTVAQKFPGLEKKIIFITGGLFSEGSREFLKTVPNLCLEKPFKFEELLEAVSQWRGGSIRLSK